MIKIVYLLMFIVLFKSELQCQNIWYVYFGLNNSNIIHKQAGQQIVYNHTLNSPLWNYGFQVGGNLESHVSSNLLYSFGLKLQLNGDKKSINEIFPDFSYHNLRFFDLILPINLKYKILNSKDIYIKGGISGTYLLFQNKYHFFPIYTFKERLGLLGQIGFNFLLINKLSVELIYSQGITNIYSIHSFPGTSHRDNELTYQHQAFELSFTYRL